MNQFIKDLKIYLGHQLNFHLVKKLSIVGNRKLNIAFYVHIILIWLLIAIWMLCNNGHVIVSNNMHSTVGLSIKEALNTNHSKDDFNTHYVKPEEFQNYNRVWDLADFVFKFSTEIQVMTNMAITANQKMSECPEHSMIAGIVCHMNSSDCKKGLDRPHGIQTVRSISSHFPYQDKHGMWTNVDVCQIRGWCPVDRVLPPLKAKSAVLIDTKNTTLWIKNSVVFPDHNFTLDNTFGESLKYFLKCRYNPVTDPHCPEFVLGDIVKYTPNAQQSYEEIAKYGSTIIINIKWDCFVNIFSHLSVEQDCKPVYTFRRIDDEKQSPTTGYTSYRYAIYYENGKKRTHFRSYRIRFVVVLTAFISQYDFFHFITNTLTYTGFFSLTLSIFGIIVRYKYRNSKTD